MQTLAGRALTYTLARATAMVREVLQRLKNRGREMEPASQSQQEADRRVTLVGQSNAVMPTIIRKGYRLESLGPL